MLIHLHHFFFHLALLDHEVHICLFIYSIIKTPTRIIITVVSEIILLLWGASSAAASSAVQSILGDKSQYKWIDVALQLRQGNECRRT